MAVPELLRRLLTAPGPSGYEAAATKVWREAASEFADVSGDILGSSVARVPGTAGGPSLAVLGHIDEIGLIITHADDNGFLYMLRVGGWRPEVLVGQRVELVTRGWLGAGRGRAQGAQAAQARRGVPETHVRGPAHRHRRELARRGARARLDRRRGCDRRRAGRARAGPVRLAVARQPPGRLRRARSCARGRRGRGSARRLSGRGRGSGGDRPLRGRADERVLARAGGRPGRGHHRGD